MSNFTLLHSNYNRILDAWTASYCSCSPQSLVCMAKEEVDRFLEAHSPGITGRDQSTRSPGMLRALLALAALGQGALPLTPSSCCRVGSSCWQPAVSKYCLTVFQCFQPAFLTTNLWKKNTIWHLTPEKPPISALHSIIHKTKNWTAHVMYQANAIFLFAKTLASK